MRGHGIAVLWVAMLIAFSLWAAPSFATWNNTTLILGAAALTALYAAGVAFGVLAGVLDLSIPGVSAFAGVVCGELLVHGAPAVIGLVAGIGCGVLVGLMNGFAAEQGLNPLVVTIGTLSVLTGLAAVVSGGVPVTGFTQLSFLGTDSLAGIPTPVFVVAVVYTAGWVMLTRTRVGLRLQAVGDDAEAARRAGVPTGHYRLLGFVLSASCAALGGIMTAATITQASANANAGVLFDALTAVALSGMPLTGGRGSLPRVLVGTLIIASIASVLAIKGIPPYWTTVATGVLLIAALIGERALR